MKFFHNDQEFTYNSGEETLIESTYSMWESKYGVDHDFVQLSTTVQSVGRINDGRFTKRKVTVTIMYKEKVEKVEEIVR
ncbi:hypothetical protein NVP1031O_047 [Vibrio phage 1.031.O._10N.261.46.F8]|nr:hypothetical protein NVP1031O_047 [Vibrio phage 1.031.O._10N.261.46.F8]